MAVVTNEQFNCSRTFHRSIVKEIVQTDSIESGCKSAEEDETGALNSSTNFELSIRTVVGGSANDIRETDIHCSSNNVSTESIPRRYTSACSQSPCTTRKFQRFSRERLRSLSPNSHLETNDEEKPTSIIPSRSQSFDTLPLAPLHETTTGDSGTGGSLTLIPIETSTPAFHYDVVPVYGLDQLVLMPNRYEFDPNKIVAYRNRKRGFLSPKPSDKPPHSGNEITSEPNKQDSRESKKSKSLFSRIRNMITPTPSQQIQFLPVIRHHPSNNTTDENH